ncbi:amidase [Labrys monachus]|uniref:Aspartyl-tRNA(Asn)/glutamyl-tRNA(Gln) amidotransferase subunit A n=1 Tax=Labrys monachus TaxID=217067 RepID=A0ABU0FFG6_9HYPH|nr:amidase [Labrys monachus]MDQ0393350.1 aspartyl-tRNA(Asn)/glutamyl-tRNA(Gln) amidotransferase subunit A [Labrys monachus]
MSDGTAPSARTADLLHLTMREASQAIRSRRLSPVELVEACLARITAVDDRIGSYILVTAEQARLAAREAEADIAAGRWRGPLHGLPFAVKDNYFSKGVRTCANSRLLIEHVPSFSATALTRLADAGAVLLGKLNTWEYGTSMGPVYDDLPYAPARNPWNPARFTGGSSTGAGAAVPARTAMFALGSDTGGSVRLPAAACGLQGLKPTYGLVSRHGILPNCWAFDTAGPLCWNVWDCAVVLQAIAGFDAMDPISAGTSRDYAAGLEDGVAGLTIGLIADCDCDGVHPDPANLAQLAAAAETLARAGARIVPVALPAPVIRYRNAASVINWAESFAIHERDFRERGGEMGQALRDKMMAGLSVGASDYIAALRERRLLAQANAGLMADLDLLLMPGAFHVAAPAGDFERVAAFTGDTAMTPFSISGHPAMTLCSGFDEDGMPTNIQLVGRWFEEATLLRAAFAYESATPWRERFPTLT